MKYATHIGTDVPESLTYDEERNALHVGPGVFTGVPPGVWNYEVGEMRIVRKWFGYRKASPTSRRTSPLDDIHVTSWPSTWTEELIELLSVLRRLVDLVPAQHAVTVKIVNSPVISRADLTSSGILPPQPRANRGRRRVVLEFDDPAQP
ncbi:type ISP restriction/modification enzyme [Streptomyces mirabilis]|uniref:type ISP restriction/modification enzyme n=1 Tax=Streptomyces mirabilis TaxID=68239 RepID=UPI0031BA6C94